MNDNAIEAVINEDEKIAEQLDEKFHGRSPEDPSSVDRASAWLTARTFVSPMRYATFNSCAARHDGRIVTDRAAYLVLDARQEMLGCWMKADRLAAPLARDGDPEPIHIEETDANFTIDWKGHYRIEGDGIHLRRSEHARNPNYPRIPDAEARGRSVTTASFNTSGLAEISNMFGWIYACSSHKFVFALDHSCEPARSKQLLIDAR